MLQNNGGAKVERCRVIVKTVNNAVQWCQYGRASFHENVQASMDRAPFGSIVASNLVLVASVDQACLVVSADANTAVCGPHASKNMVVELVDIGIIDQATQFSTANAQVKDDGIGGVQVGFNDASKCVLVALQPRYQRVGVGTRRQLAGVAKAVMGKAGMDSNKLCKQGPGGLFADRQVGIVRLDLLLISRVDYAYTEAHAHQRIEHAQFGLRQWERLVIASDDRRCRRQWIGFAQHGVGRGNGEFADSAGLHHVAKINHTDDTAMLACACDARQDIVIVGVVVNDAGAQGG